MPFEIVKSEAGGKKGYRLRKEGTNTYYSKKALPKNVVYKQRTAIIASEATKKDLKEFRDGGFVKVPEEYRKLREDRYRDIVPAILEPHELVIPVKYSNKVSKFLKDENIKLPNM